MGLMARVDFLTNIRVGGKDIYGMNTIEDGLIYGQHGVTIVGEGAVIFVPYTNIKSIVNVKE